MLPGINTNTTKSDFLLLYFDNCLGTPFLGMHFYDCFHHLYLQSILLSCKRTSKTVGLLWKFLNVLMKTSKLLVRPRLHHCDIVHDQAYNFAFHQKVQPFQFNATLTVIGSIRETSREKLQQDLGLDHFN